MRTRGLRPIARGGLIFVLATLLGSAQHFPPLDQDNPPKSRVVRRLQFCMMARKVIPLDAQTPLLTFDFAPPGASGSVLIDKKTIQTFKNEQHLLIRANVSAGQHLFNLFLDAPANNTFMISNEDFKYCRG